MKGWITAALVVTFLSGGSTGYLVGRNTAEPPSEKSWIDNYVETLRTRYGVTEEQDLARARAILEERDEKLMKLRSKVMELLEEQIENINGSAEREIREIMDRHAKARPADGDF